MKIYISILASLIAVSVTYSREPPVQFPPITNGYNSAALPECEATLDRIVLPSINYSNTPLNEVWNSLFDQSTEYDPKRCGLSTVVNIGPHLNPDEMLLPPIPETITLTATNITLRQALNEICLKANLSWRLSPIPIISRPELFLKPELTKQSQIMENPEEWGIHIEQAGPGYPPQSVGSPDP